MKGTALLLLCALALTRGEKVQLTVRGTVCNCNPSEAANVCSQSGSDSQFIVHENCNQFYQCANGLPHEHFCANGLVYNPLTERCDWPHNVDCGGRPIVTVPEYEDKEEEVAIPCYDDPSRAQSVCAASGSASILVAHENCNQFYICNQGLPTTVNCPVGLNYDPCRRLCDVPDNVDCGNRPVIEIGQVTQQPDEVTTTGSCNCNPAEAPTICAADNSDGILIAHANCDKFYICNHGKPVTTSCPSNLLYNPYTTRCDWPANVDCGDRIVPCDCAEGNNDEDCSEESGQNETGGTDSGNETGGGSEDGGSGGNGGGSGDGGSGGSGGTCNCNPGEAPAICAVDGSEGVLIAHENCNQFYKCNYGLPVAMYCPSGLLYNPYLQWCDWPENVECGDRPIVEPESGGEDNGSGGSDTGTGGGSGDGGSGGSGGTCNCNPVEAPAICAVNGSDGVLIAHENCNQFYKCSEGIPVALYCPAGLLYNPYLQWCDWPENVECGDRPIVEPESGGEDNGSGGSDTGTGGGSGDGGSGGSGGTCNCNPVEAPAICAVNGSDGVLIAHENCNQFYKCSEGIPVAMYCPSGLLYNPYREWCDWPENVECGDKPIVEPESGGEDNGSGGSDTGTGGGSGDGGSGGSGGTCNCNPVEAPAICAVNGSDGVLIAHENCNQFYKCSEGIPVALYCPAGLLYNPYLQWCDWPENVECGDRPIVEPESGGEDNGSGGSDTGTGGGSGDGGSGGSGGTCNCNPVEAPAICAVNGSDGVLIAHENCNQFYKCSEGIPVALYCPAGLLYNPYLQWCDWPENVECGDRPIVEPESGGEDNGSGGSDTGTGGGSGDGGSGGSGGTCNCNPVEAPAICAVNGSDGVLIAHENCNQFYKCSEGIPVALYCPAGLLYNPYLQWCDWPENVECGDRPIVEPESGGEDNGSGGSDTGTGGGSGDGGSGGSGGTCNCNPVEAPAICAVNGSDGVLIAHENCNQFYKCSEGIPVAMYCPSGLLYNPYREWCDWPENVECGDKPIVEPESGGEDNGSGGSDTGTGGGSGDGGSGGSGGTCNCNPVEAPAICAVNGSDGVLIAHENCNQFYKCSEGIPVAMYCPSGLLYNPYREWCDWPENVECGDKPIVEPESGGEDNGSGGSDTGTGGGSGDGGSGGSGGTCNCNPGEAPAICAVDGSEGVLIAHENCNQFYKCNYGLPVAMYCPSGLLYNPYLERCDWPQNVECGDRPIVENETGGDDNANDDDKVITGTYCDPSEAPTVCANAGSNGIQVAHENCNQFYVCYAGVPIGLHCPNNLLYNSLTELCDWPYNVDCGDRVREETVDSGSGDCACNPRMASSLCSDTKSTGKLVAHENCNQFYICIQGAAVAMTCPSGLFYEPHQEICTWLPLVDCNERNVVSHKSLNKHVNTRRGDF